MSNLCTFEKGDFIVGTKGKELLNGSTDNSWKDTIFEILGVFESHLIVKSVSGFSFKTLFHFDELETWGFIIANPEMVEIMKVN